MVAWEIIYFDFAVATYMILMSFKSCSICCYYVHLLSCCFLAADNTWNFDRQTAQCLRCATSACGCLTALSACLEFDPLMQTGSHDRWNVRPAFVHVGLYAYIDQAAKYNTTAPRIHETKQCRLIITDYLLSLGTCCWCKICCQRSTAMLETCLTPKQCSSTSCSWHSRASALWDSPVHQSWHVASQQSWPKPGWLLHLGAWCRSVYTTNPRYARVVVETWAKFQQSLVDATNQ